MKKTHIVSEVVSISICFAPVAHETNPKKGVIRK